MRTKRIAAFLLAVGMAFGLLAGPASAAGPEPAAPAVSEESLAEENEIIKLPVTVSMSVNKGATYGESCGLTVTTNPENVQYVGVVIGMSGRAKGYVGVILPEKVRILLKLVPLPQAMASEKLTKEQKESFSVYEYVKQLIDGRQVEDLLKVAEEVAVLLEAMEYYIPDLRGVGAGIKSVVNLADTYIPEGLETRVYLDEEPQDAGRYMTGALTVDTRYVNTSIVKTLTIRQKTEGVSAGWSVEAPASMTAAQAAQFDFTAKVYDGGEPVPDTVDYTYTGWTRRWRYYRSAEPPTEPGRYTQKAAANGNYKSAQIARSFTITE